MAACLTCPTTCDGSKLTNQRLRRNAVLVDYYYLNPATPLLPNDEAAYPGLNAYARVNGMLVGQDATTGYLKMAWEYDDADEFALEFVGALDFAEPNVVGCATAPRKCGGKVTVITLGGGLELELATAQEIWSGQAVTPYLDTSGTSDFVHPFKVTVSASATNDEKIGHVKNGKPGVTACAVEINVQGKTVKQVTDTDGASS